MLSLEPNMLAEVVSARLTRLRKDADTQRRLASARERSKPEPRPSSPWRRAIARMRLAAPRHHLPVRPRAVAARRRSDPAFSSAAVGAHAGAPVGASAGPGADRRQSRQRLRGEADRRAAAGEAPGLEERGP